MKQLPGILVSIGMVAATPVAAQSTPSREEQAAKEIRAQADKLKDRKDNTSLFDDMITEGYAEFNPFFPFLVDPPKSVSVAMAKEFDAHDRTPPTDRGHKIEKLQVYGDVALLTFTSVAKGNQVGPGFTAQAKFLSIYVKKNGVWLLVQSHDARRTGPEGVPID